MSWPFKDPVVIMKQIMSWLFKDPINSGLAQFDHAQSNWLFKDPINSGLAQFDHAQSSSKKWLKAKKIKLPQMIFFSRKTNKIFMYLLDPFIL